jgi:Family of unknown function (DUF5989)
MPRLGYTLKLLREIWGFARENKVYWIVPLVIFLGIAAFLVSVGQASAPLLYTLF